MHLDQGLPRILAAGLCLLASVAAAQKKEPPAEKKVPPVVIEAVTIDPPSPSVDTLCQLRVQVKNASATTLSALDFGVSLGGAALKVYENQLFLESLEPGKTAEIRLYNFWTTETGRPAPSDGKLRLAVTLRAAQHVEITTEDDGTEVWTLGEAVAGLPVSKELVVELKKK